jgi:hypothetical protein
VKRGRKVESTDVAIWGNFQEVWIQVLVEICTKILGELGKTFGEFIRLLELLDSATCGEDSKH